MALKPYLQLVRLPNVFTAAADSLAGWLLVGGGLAAFDRWLPLSAASMAIYAAGIALNDVFDYAIDLEERPGRPLPSGRVSRRFAAWLGGILLALGPCLAALSGSWSSLAVALALVACVLGYNAGLKRTVLGPEVMGACRGLNLLLGMSQAERPGRPHRLARGRLARALRGGRDLDQPLGGRDRGADRGDRGRDDPAERGDPGAHGRRPAAGAVPLALGRSAHRAAGRAPRPPGRRLGRQPRHGPGDPRADPGPDPGAVKTGVFSLVWLDVGLVAAVRGPLPALAVALLWVPAFFLGRWLYST